VGHCVLFFFNVGNRVGFPVNSGNLRVFPLLSSSGDRGTNLFAKTCTVVQVATNVFAFEAVTMVGIQRFICIGQFTASFQCVPCPSSFSAEGSVGAVEIPKCC